MSLKHERAPVEREWMEGLLADTLGPLGVLRGNSDLLILPDMTAERMVLNPYTVDICTLLISHGIVAKIVIGNDYSTGPKPKGRLPLPDIFSLSPAKENEAYSLIAEWIMKWADDADEASIGIIAEREEGLVKYSMSGKPKDVGEALLELR